MLAVALAGFTFGWYRGHSGLVEYRAQVEAAARQAEQERSRIAAAEAENHKRQVEDLKVKLDATRKRASTEYGRLVQRMLTEANPKQSTDPNAATGSARARDDAELRELLRISEDLDRGVREAQGDYEAAREQAIRLEACQRTIVDICSVRQCK